MADYYFYTEKMAVGYNGAPLLENIEIGLNRGEILTLIGPNGAGKSTVLKSIARQLRLVAGTAYLDRQPLEGISAADLSRKMVVVFTQRPRTEMMTCEEVVATGRYPYTGRFGILSKEDREAVYEAMELVRILELRNKDFNKLSDGQRQRVMMARAICQRPEIILLDEPTSYLDIKYKLEFLSLLQEMTRMKKLSVIMSLHELDLAKRISDKLLCVGSEGVERYGTPEEVFREDYICSLFHMTAGSFNEINDSIELEPPRGEPQVFVIAGAGTGRDTYRRLQRQNIPFVTGILYENDLDYPVARALAAHTISVSPFDRISRDKLAEAKQWLGKCGKVICCRRQFSDWEQESRALFEQFLKNSP